MPETHQIRLEKKKRETKCFTHPSGTHFFGPIKALLQVQKELGETLTLMYARLSR